MLSYLTLEAISKKVRQPNTLASLKLPSVADLSAILEPQTFTCNDPLKIDLTIATGEQEIQMLDNIQYSIVNLNKYIFLIERIEKVSHLKLIKQNKLLKYI